MTRVLLIRHGANDAQQDDILAGWTPGVHLNAAGRAQAQALAHRLSTVEIAALYASPLERTMDTANIIAQDCGLSVQVREGLGEVRYGQWTGQPLEALQKRALWPVVQFTPSMMRFPEGESIREVQARAVAEVEELRAIHPEETVALVSHADVIKSIIAHYVGLHLDLFQRLAIAPASLTILVLENAFPRLICLNDTSYLPITPKEDKK